MECPRCHNLIPEGSRRCICGHTLQEVPVEKKEKKKGGGFFDPEKKGIEKGVIGGLIMIVIAVVWFVAGHAAGYIFYYPPILFLIGVYALIRGLITGNIRGEKAAIKLEAAIPVSEIKPVSSLSEIFDQERFGFNLPAGFGYFAAGVLTWFSWPFVSWVLQGYSFNLWPFKYYMISAVLLVIETGIFLYCLHRIHSPVNLPVIFGAAYILIGIVSRLIFRSLGNPSAAQINVLDSSSLLIGFSFGFLIMLGLVLGVRFLGLKPWTFLAGLAVMMVVQSVFIQIYFSLKEPHFSFSIVNLVSPLLDGCILGLLLYAGLSAHLQKIGFVIKQGRILPAKGFHHPPIVRAG